MSPFAVLDRLGGHGRAGVVARDGRNAGVERVVVLVKQAPGELRCWKRQSLIIERRLHFSLVADSIAGFGIVRRDAHGVVSRNGDGKRLRLGGRARSLVGRSHLADELIQRGAVGRGLRNRVGKRRLRCAGDRLAVDVPLILDLCAGRFDRRRRPSDG